MLKVLKSPVTNPHGSDFSVGSNIAARIDLPVGLVIVFDIPRFFYGCVLDYFYVLPGLLNQHRIYSW